MKIDIREAFGVGQEKEEHLIDVKVTMENKEEPEPEETVEHLEGESVEESDEEPVDEPAEELIEEAEEEPEAEEPLEEAEEEPEAEEPLEEAEEEPEAEEPLEEAEEDPEIENQREPEQEEQPAEKPALKARVSAFCMKYGSLTAIGAAFVCLMIVLVIYTSMIPKDVHAVINGEEMKFITKANTVEDFLDAEGIEFCEDDYSSLPLTAFIHDGMKFEIRHATEFDVTADGETKAFRSLKNKVGEALKDVGVKIGEDDIIEPDAESLLTAGMSIVVKRVTYKEEVKEEVVEYKTKNKDDSSMAEGTSKVVTEGKNGKDKVTYKVKYIDGEEADREEIDRETIEKAVDKVVANGTRINYNGKNYSRKITVKAYAYTGGGTTAMGTKARVGEIAVDPSVIPLGTNVYIEGVGARRAEDTGGNIKGNTIDIYMNSEAECRRWGVRYVTIYIE